MKNLSVDTSDLNSAKSIKFLGILPWKNHTGLDQFFKKIRPLLKTSLQLDKKCLVKCIFRLSTLILTKVMFA